MINKKWCFQLHMIFHYLLILFYMFPLKFDYLRAVLIWNVICNKGHILLAYSVLVIIMLDIIVLSQSYRFGLIMCQTTRAKFRENTSVNNLDQNFMIFFRHQILRQQKVVCNKVKIHDITFNVPLAKQNELLFVKKLTS